MRCILLRGYAQLWPVCSLPLSFTMTRVRGNREPYRRSHEGLNIWNCFKNSDSVSHTSSYSSMTWRIASRTVHIISMRRFLSIAMTFVLCSSVTTITIIEQ